MSAPYEISHFIDWLKEQKIIKDDDLKYYLEDYLKTQPAHLGVSFNYALTWYKKGCIDATDGEIFEDGIESDFYDSYGEEFEINKS